MEVVLLKKVGEYPAGSKLDIQDKTVLDTWVKLGVIKGDDLSKKTKSELQNLAESLDSPKEEWKNLNKTELIEYLSEK